jgi:membrane-associated phospholipid phosphatase
MDVTAFAHAHALALIVCALIAVPAGGALAWHVFTRTLDGSPPRARTSLIAAVTLAVALGGVALFALMARRLVAGDAFAAADQRLLDALRDGLPQAASRGFAQFTHLGDPWFLALLCALACAFLVLGRRSGLALYLAAVTGAGGLVNRALKLGLQRARPLDALVPLPDSFSFPSGHTFGSMVCYGMCAYVLLRIAPRYLHGPVIALTCFAVLAIGLSRVVIGVHFPGDVAGGFAAGGAWLAAWVGVAEVARRRGRF